MKLKINPYIVYVRLDDSGYIVDINSSAFLYDTTEWVEIDSGYGDKYHHAQGNYFTKPIFNMGIYYYKLVDGKPVECSIEEITEQNKSNKSTEMPSQLDIIEAQVTYTAIMTDTLLEV